MAEGDTIELSDLTQLHRRLLKEHLDAQLEELQGESSLFFKGRTYNDLLAEIRAAREADKKGDGAKSTLDGVTLVKGRRTKLTVKMRCDFLRDLAQHGNFSRACRENAVSATTMQRLKRLDEDFEAMCLLAKDQYRHSVRDQVRFRAYGYPAPVFHQGVLTDVRMEWNPRMLELEAKRVEPGYRDKPLMEANVGAGGVLVVQGTLDEEAWSSQYGDG